MESDYKPVEKEFRQAVEALAARREKVNINYITDLRELLTTTGMIKELSVRDGAEYARLSTGEEIRLDRIVRLNDALAPGYGNYEFGNSCAL